MKADDTGEPQVSSPATLPQNLEQARTAPTDVALAYSAGYSNDGEMRNSALANYQIPTQRRLPNQQQLWSQQAAADVARKSPGWTSSLAQTSPAAMGAILQAVLQPQQAAHTAPTQDISATMTALRHARFDYAQVRSLAQAAQLAQQRQPHGATTVPAQGHNQLADRAGANPHALAVHHQARDHANLGKLRHTMLPMFFYSLFFVCVSRFKIFEELEWYIKRFVIKTVEVYMHIFSACDNATESCSGILTNVQMWIVDS